jgi:arylsulfatase A-like enzyme
MRPLNLLFVFADQMRFCDMGCAGNREVRTPTLDRLAAEGTRLTHCFTTSPVCGPNRAVLLTGTYPITNRVPANDLALPEHLPSFGTIARRHGWKTGYVGKWHLDGVPRSKFTPPGPRRSGFDFWAVHNCTHDYFNPQYYRDSPELIRTEGYEPEVQTGLALEFLERQKPGEPFCLFLSWGPPHDPYPRVPERLRGSYDPDRLTLRPNMEPEARNALAAGLDCRRTLADYYAAITALDEQLDRLLKALDSHAMRENTVVVFTSDHGDMLWSHGWMKKQAPFDESVRVPFLIRAPGVIPAGASSAGLVATVDLLPTLAALLGWRCPPGIEGSDRSALLRGEGGAVQPETVMMGHYYAGDEAARQGMPEWRAVRTPRHTYVELPGRQPWLLFDNETDPHQLLNLVDRPGHAETQARLSSALTGWLTTTKDPALPGAELLDQMRLTEAWTHRERVMRGPR